MTVKVYTLVDLYSRLIADFILLKTIWVCHKNIQLFCASIEIRCCLRPFNCSAYERSREITLPELSGYDFSASHGIFSSERDVKAAAAYDLQQEMRYKKAWFEKPEGGYTVDFNKPLPCEDDPYPFPEAFCRTEKEMTVLETEMTAGQSDIIINALEIQCCIENGDFKKLFSYYTEDERALGYAQKITDIYSQIPISRYYQGKTDD